MYHNWKYSFHIGTSPLSVLTPASGACLPTLLTGLVGHRPYFKMSFMSRAFKAIYCQSYIWHIAVYKLHFASDDCHILNNMGRTACTGHLHGNLYLMDIKVTTSEKICIAHLDPAPQDNDKVEFALIACTNTCKTILDAWHRCLGHPLMNINMNKNNLTPDDKGGVTMAHASEERALTASLLIHQPQPQGP